MSLTRRFSVLATVLTTLALAACGGGGNDEEDAEQTVRDIAAATSDTDGDKFCDLITKKFQEQLTGNKGDKAKDACRKLIDSQKASKVDVTKITKVELDGDKATVTAELESSGQKRPQVFTLKKEDGEFRLAGAKE